MKSRGLVVAIAVVLAVLAAAGVIIYTNNIEEKVLGEDTALVVVSNQDIAANTPLTPLLDAGVFSQIRVANDAVVIGAITNPEELRGETSAAFIFANEQIPVDRLASGDGLDVLGISEGNVGLGIALDGPAAVNGHITQGSYVVVYAHFKQGTPITKDALDKLLSPAQVQKFFDAYTGESTTIANQPVYFMPSDFTLTLVKSVKVLSVQNPEVDQTTGRRGDGATTLALDLAPQDAEEVVFGTQVGTLYLGLLPSKNEEGYDTGATVGVPLAKVAGVA
jgi:Flp pilus assembly protein CpaB